MSAAALDADLPVDPLTLALDLARLGIAVVPARADKRPATPNGVLDASTDPQVVADMFIEHDASQVGIHVGRSGLIAVDIDKHPGAPNGFESIGELDLPKTYGHTSLSGNGYHAFYAAPEGVAVTGHNSIPGVDVIANGHILWSGPAPASRDEFAPAPAWTIRERKGEGRASSEVSPELVAEWIAGNVGAIDPHGALAHALAALPPHGDPRWNNAELVSLALSIVRPCFLEVGGTSAREAFIARYAAGEWATERYRKDAARAFAKAIDLEGIPRPFIPFSPVIDIATGEPASEAPTGAPPPPRLHRLADLMEVDFPELQWIIPGVIPEGVTLLVAPPKAGKSWFALDTALACATGRDALGSIPTGAARPVLYVDLESGERRLQARVNALGWQDFGRFEYLLDRETAWTAIDAFMTEHARDRPLVVIDTLAGIMGDKPKDTTQYLHEYRTLSRLQAIAKADPGAGIMIAHHTRKMTGDDPMDRVSGTNGVAGAVDTPIVLDRPDRHKPDGVLNVMARDFEGGEFAIYFDGTRWVLAGGTTDAAQQAHEQQAHDARRANLGPVAQGILLVIESQPGHAWTFEEIAATYGGTSARDTQRRTIRRLVEQGHVLRAGRGTYSAA